MERVTIDGYNGVLERVKGGKVGNRHDWARFACKIGHELLPVYNRGGMLTWLFTKIGKKIEIKMAQNCCDDGSLNFLGVEYKSVQWHYGSSSSAKLRMLLLESGRTASY